MPVTDVFAEAWRETRGLSFVERVLWYRRHMAIPRNGLLRPSASSGKRQEVSEKLP